MVYPIRVHGLHSSWGMARLYLFKEGSQQMNRTELEFELQCEQPHWNPTCVQKPELAEH